MSSIILCVFEGAKTEPHIFDNLKNLFFKKEDKDIVYALFNASIYKLWKEIKDDTDFDTLEILREIIINKDILKDVKRVNISEIHLFFDHDAHTHEYLKMSSDDYNDLISKMLSTFNDEYEQGKLWINYPMAEALRHCKKDLKQCFNCIWEISENKKYKQFVAEMVDYQDCRKFSREDWFYFTTINLQKALSLIDKKDIYQYEQFQPLLDEKQQTIEQTIYAKQLEKFIKPKSSVAVLSAFPIFLIYYFGKPLYQEVCKLNIIKECNFKHI